MTLIQTTLLCGIDQISLPMTSRRGERFFDDYYITRDRDKIIELVGHFGDALGSVEAKYLVYGANAVIYRNSSLESTGSDTQNISIALEKQIIHDMLVIKGLESALWMIKDNACHFDRAWIAGTVNQKQLVHSNFWASRNSSAQGSFEAVCFSSDELKIARSSRRPIGVHLKGVDTPTALSKGSQRFQRFEYFLQAARTTLDIAMKIAQYCSGLEALVSTSQQELSHQVSERVAALLVGPGAKRVAIFKLVKKAYGFRSKTVHGASFTPAEVAQLCDCAKIVDQLCRALQALYFDSDPSFRSAVEGKDEQSSAFFIEAVMGGRIAPDRLDIELKD